MVKSNICIYIYVYICNIYVYIHEYIYDLNDLLETYKMNVIII